MIALTGASGFLGTAIAQALGDDCVPICRTRLASSLQPRTVDLLDAAAIDQITEALDGVHVDAIIHAAAVTPWSQVPKYAQDMRMAQVIAEFCNTHAIPKLVFISGWIVYSASAEVPYSESAMVEPSTDYGKSKLAVEQYLAAHLTVTQLCIVRPSTIYGPGQKSPGLITNFCTAADSGVIAPTALETKRDYLFVDDFVTAIVKLSSFDTVPRIINLGSGNSVTVLTIAETIAQIYGELYDRSVTVKTPLNPIEATPINNQLDIAAAQRLGLLTNVMDTSEGVKKYIQWAKS